MHFEKNCSGFDRKILMLLYTINDFSFPISLFDNLNKRNKLEFSKYDINCIPYFVCVALLLSGTLRYARNDNNLYTQQNF